MTNVKPGVLLTVGIALAAVLVRAAGAESLADLIATGYLAVATVACAPSWTPSGQGVSSRQG